MEHLDISVTDAATTNNTDKLASQITWNEEQLFALHSVFQEELEQNDVSLNNVRSKIKDKSVLSAIDDRKVYDHLRSEIRQKCSCNADQSVLPENADTAYDRVARMLLPKPQAALQSDNILSDKADSEFVPPSSRETNKDIF